MADDTLIHTPNGGLPRLRAIMRALRDPETGCPWDIEQTFATIAPYTIEEAYEVADAIEREAWDELKGELGDLLFQSVFHAQMAEEAGLFSLDDVADTMSDKMVTRHPHVFGAESRNKSAEQQTRDWEAIKAAERARRDPRARAIHTAIHRAQAINPRAIAQMAMFSPRHRKSRHRIGHALFHPAAAVDPLLMVIVNAL